MSLVNNGHAWLSSFFLLWEIDLPTGKGACPGSMRLRITEFACLISGFIINNLTWLVELKPHPSTYTPSVIQGVLGFSNFLSCELFFSLFTFWMRIPSETWRVCKGVYNIQMSDESYVCLFNHYSVLRTWRADSKCNFTVCKNMRKTASPTCKILGQFK